MHRRFRVSATVAILLVGLSLVPVSATDAFGSSSAPKDWAIETSPSGTIFFFCRSAACGLNSLVSVRLHEMVAPDRATLPAQWGTTDIACGQLGPFDYCQAHRLFDGSPVVPVENEKTGQVFDATVIVGHVINRRMEADGYPVLISIVSSSDDARLAEVNFIMVRDLLIQNHVSWPP